VHVKRVTLRVITLSLVFTKSVGTSEVT
jgi:hypothetical protein